jgi:hypothetical protein
MHQEIQVVQQAYQAYAGRNLPDILGLIVPQVEWEFVGSAPLPYVGRQRARKEVADFPAGGVCQHGRPLRPVVPGYSRKYKSTWSDPLSCTGKET